LKPLLYLELRQLVNSLRNTLRSPKRLIPALVMSAWGFALIMQCVLLGSGVERGMRRGFPILDAPKGAEMIRVGAFAFLCLHSIAIIYQAFSNGAMVFSIAHIDFLFPTPISRRWVLLIKLLKDLHQVRVLGELVRCVRGRADSGRDERHPVSVGVREHRRTGRLIS